jgi:hypothetical protein
VGDHIPAIQSIHGKQALERAGRVVRVVDNADAAGGIIEVDIGVGDAGQGKQQSEAERGSGSHIGRYTIPGSS